MEIQRNKFFQLEPLHIDTFSEFVITVLTKTEKFVEIFCAVHAFLYLTLIFFSVNRSFFFLMGRVNISYIEVEYLKSCQTSKMECFAKIVNG